MGYHTRWIRGALGAVTPGVLFLESLVHRSPLTPRRLPLPLLWVRLVYSPAPPRMYRLLYALPFAPAIILT